MSEHHSWNGSSQIWPPPSDNPVPWGTAGLSYSKTSLVEAACPWAPSSHPHPYPSVAGDLTWLPQGAEAAPQRAPRGAGGTGGCGAPGRGDRSGGPAGAGAVPVAVAGLGGPAGLWLAGHTPPGLGSLQQRGHRREVVSLGGQEHPHASHGSPAPTSTQGMSCGSSLPRDS